MAQDQPVICHVLHQLYLAGAEVLAAGLARQLSFRYRFVFACLDDLGPLGDRLRSEGFDVTVLNRRPGVDWTVSTHLRQICKRHKVALIHAHQYSPFFYAANSRGIFGTLRSRPPILFTEHGRHYPDVRSAKRVLFNKLALSRYDRVTAVGRFIKRALVDNEGIPYRCVKVIYNGVDPAKFDTVTERKQMLEVRTEMRKKLGIDLNAPVALQVARMHPVKDHITAVAAMRYVVDEIPNAVMLFAGDGVERRRVEAKIVEFGLKKNFKMLGVREDIPSLLVAADVFCLSSVSEGISVTLLEAMAASRAIAATDVGGNGEVVGHNSNGLLSKRQDAKGLGNNLTTLLRNPALQSRMGSVGRERLITQFSQAQMHDAYTRLYDEMIKDTR